MQNSWFEPRNGCGIWCNMLIYCYIFVPLKTHTMTRCFRKNIAIDSETLAFWSSMLVSVEVFVEALYIQVQMLGVEPTKNLGLLSDGQLRRLYCRKGKFGRCLFFHCFSSSLFCWGGCISDSVCFRGVGGSTAFLEHLHFYHSPKFKQRDRGLFGRFVEVFWRLEAWSNNFLKQRVPLRLAFQAWHLLMKSPQKEY